MNVRHGYFVVALLAGHAVFAGAADTKIGPWDLRPLTVAPKTFDDPQHSTPDVKAIYYEGLPWKGKPTRVFAFCGVPKVAEGKKVPAMVLVHGGGGTAYVPWVKLWVSRGYAAIAMDTCGAASKGEYNSKQARLTNGGPPGWGGFDQIDWPVEDQWTYHAVAGVILAHSLIRSWPEVDPERTGITGISWGGYLTCIAAGVDSRFKFAAPVYGCGFLRYSHWADTFRKMDEEKAQRWLALWDPSVYLSRAATPMLWVDGTNDFAYSMDSLQQSYRLPKAPRTLCTRVRMPHAHGGAGENPKEIHAMAEAMLNGGTPLPQIVQSSRESRNVSASFQSKTPIVRAELNYTTDRGKWQKRKWQTTEATLDAKTGTARATLPEGATAYYLNLIARGDLVVSSEHEEISPN